MVERKPGPARGSALQGLAGAAQALASSRGDVDTVLAQTAHHARRLLGAHRSIATLRDDRAGSRAGRAVSLSDAYAAGDLGPPPTDDLLSVPLVAADGRDIGLLQVASKVEGHFDPDDEAMLALLARIASAAIEGARLHQAVRGREHRMRALFAVAAHGVVVVDASGRVSEANDAAARLLPPAGALVGRYVRDLLDQWEVTTPEGTALEPQDFPALRVLRHGGSISDELLVVRAPGEGERRWLLMGASALEDAEHGVTEAIATFSDVSDRERLAEQLRHAQRMDAVGRLAGAVAHDFNNLLTAILGFADLYLARISDEPREVVEIRRSAASAAVLVEQLLAFSRPREVVARPLDVGDVVLDVASMLQRLVGSRVRLRLDLADDLPLASADAGHVQQVLVNLVVNAADALPDGGPVEVITRAADPAELPPGEHRPADRYVRLTVADRGVGMSPDVARRCLDPFFTTKAPGSGTGLGLSIVYGIATRFGGAVTVDTAVGEGTAVSVWLPAADTPPQSAVPAAPAAPPVRAGATVLLVEDTDLVRAVTREALTAHGYRVVEASGGAEALARDDLEAVDLLITDVVMPDIGGIALAEKLRARRPDLPVLLVSGYAAERVELPRVGGASAFLNKPYSVAELLQAVADLL